MSMFSGQMPTQGELTSLSLSLILLNQLLQKGFGFCIKNEACLLKNMVTKFQRSEGY